ncbi:armadillo-like helical domain containing protein 1 [Anabrus simplex]|uniref:armadillo-like helical domain containing protein 1 n=1 Tax=Anabrus simplex TaxID=316456 RepID=UPI0035A31764
MSPLLFNIITADITNIVKSSPDTTVIFYADDMTWKMSLAVLQWQLGQLMLIFAQDWENGWKTITMRWKIWRLMILTKIQISSSAIQGTSMERAQFLVTFLSEFEGQPSVNLDRKLGYGASLFLARFLVWLQVSYLHSRHVTLLIKVLSLFIENVDGCRFASEIVHGGLLMVLLDIIRCPAFSNQDKINAMELLAKIAFRGRQYKEEICQTHGVKVLCEFIAHYGYGEKKDSHIASEEEKTSTCQVQSKKYNQVVMDKAQKLLITISCGNPEYKMQIIQALLVLLTSINPQAQLVACQVLIKILPHTMTMCNAAIDPLLGLLGCDDMWLLAKGLQLMKLVIKSHHGERLSKSLILLASRRCVPETNVTTLNSSQEHLRQCDALLAIENLLDTSTLQHFLSSGLENALVMNISDTSSPDTKQLSTQVLSKIRTVRSAILVKASDKDACNGDNIYDSQTSSGITSRVDESGDKMFTNKHSKKITKIEEIAEPPGDLQQALEPSQNLDESFVLSSDEQDAVDLPEDLEDQDAVDLPEDLEDFEYLSLDLDESKSVSEI